MNINNNATDIPRLRDHLPQLAERKGSAFERQAQHKAEQGFERLFWEYGLSIHPHNQGGGPFSLAIPQDRFRDIFPTGKQARRYIWEYFCLIGHKRGSGVSGASIYPLSFDMRRAFKQTWRDVLQQASEGNAGVLDILRHTVFKHEDGPLKILVPIDRSNLDKAILAAYEVPELIESKRSIGTLFAIKAKLVEHGLELVFTESGTGRLINPIQNIRRDVRRELFRGWHDYDVQACAPTLLSQIYTKATGKQNEVIAHFIANKTQLRHDWACAAFDTDAPTAIQTDRVKKAITGLFFGAELVTDNPYKEALTHYLGKSGVKRLKATELAELAVAIRQVFTALAGRQMWKTDQLNLAGKIYHKPAATSKNKLIAHIYQGAERAVLNCFIEYCQSEAIDFVPIHDGFISNIPIDIPTLVNLVQQRTGFQIQLDHELL